MDFQFGSGFLAAVEDPISAIFSKDWAQLGGWGLFVFLCMTIVLGSFFEVWVPGRSYRRLEAASKKQAEVIEALTTQNGQLINANEITKKFFEKTAPLTAEEKT